MEERPLQVSAVHDSLDPPIPSHGGIAVYTRALSTGLVQKDAEQIVAIVLAGAGAKRRKAEANPEGDFSRWFQVRIS